MPAPSAVPPPAAHPPAPEVHAPVPEVRAPAPEAPPAAPEILIAAALTGGTYHPAENSSQLESVFQGLPTNLITAHQVTEVSVVFLALGSLLAGLATLLGRAWRPLP